MVIADIRWRQRFENFQRAFGLLGEPIARGVDSLSVLEQEGTVQRFEVTLELAWKTLKDYLEAEGATIEPVTPRTVVKVAVATRILQDGKIWLDMLDHRNLLSHTYDERIFVDAVRSIQDCYFPVIGSLVEWFEEKAKIEDPRRMVQLSEEEIRMMEPIFRQCSGLTGVILFGSRAKGTATARSDVDLALEGVDDVLLAESLRGELEDLAIPYRFDVQIRDRITHQALREHIDRVGIRIWQRS
jgi:nucleotidyltransferase substrate binding protein (TIGR01987 family)